MGDLITLQQYAEMVGVPFRTVQSRARQGQIPSVKIGNSVMIDKSTPWEFKKAGRKSAAEQSEVDSAKQKYKVEVRKVFYVSVCDSSGKEVTSDFTFGSKADAEALGKRMKKEVEDRGVTL